MLLTISLFILTLFFIFMLPFIIILRCLNMEWSESILFSIMSIGVIPGIMWLLPNSMSLTRALFWSEVLVYGIAILCASYKRWGGVFEPTMFSM